MYCLRFTGSNLVIHKMNEGKLSNVTKEELEKLIFEEKLSYEEIGRRYSVSGYAIVKRAKKLGIELPKKRKINSSETFRKGVSKKEKAICKNCGKEFTPKKTSYGLYCCNKCQQEHQSREKYENYLKDPEPYYGKECMKWTKKYILEEQDHKCEICGMEDSWNGKPITFILDHVDGHANNNCRENLRLICPNCDSQLNTYKSRNKNSDRKERYRKSKNKE